MQPLFTGGHTITARRNESRRADARVLPGGLPARWSTLAFDEAAVSGSAWRQLRIELHTKRIRDTRCQMEESNDENDAQDGLVVEIVRTQMPEIVGRERVWLPAELLAVLENRPLSLSESGSAPVLLQ